MKDLGLFLPVRVWTDSSAAIGICTRQGLGKLRHIQTQGLWIQQRVRDRSIELRKVRGDVNPADLFTKRLQPRDRIDGLVRIFACEYRQGRPESAPQLRSLDGGQLSLPDVVDDCADGDGGDIAAVDQSKLPDVDEEDYGFGVPEAQLHDVELLPHLHSERQIREYFPVATVGPDVDGEIADYQPSDFELVYGPRQSLSSAPKDPGNQWRSGKTLVISMWWSYHIPHLLTS